MDRMDGIDGIDEMDRPNATSSILSISSMPSIPSILRRLYSPCSLSAMVAGHRSRSPSGKGQSAQRAAGVVMVVDDGR